MLANKHYQLNHISSLVSTFLTNLLLYSVHMKIEEKITLTCGRDGGLQNMELHGMIMLRISDEKFGRIRLHVENEDKKGVQLQVCKGFYIEYLDITYLAQSFLGGGYLVLQYFEMEYRLLLELTLYSTIIALAFGFVCLKWGIFI